MSFWSTGTFKICIAHSSLSPAKVSIPYLKKELLEQFNSIFIGCKIQTRWREFKWWKNNFTHWTNFQLFVYIRITAHPTIYRVNSLNNYKRRPRRPPFLRVLSDGMGVTSSAKIQQYRSLNISVLFTFSLNIYLLKWTKLYKIPRWTI